MDELANGFQNTALVDRFSDQIVRFQGQQKVGMSWDSVATLMNTRLR
jgi:hypothetical protein